MSRDDARQEALAARVQVLAGYDGSGEIKEPYSDEQAARLGTWRMLERAREVEEPLLVRLYGERPTAEDVERERIIVTRVGRQLPTILSAPAALLAKPEKWGIYGFLSPQTREKMLCYPPSGRFDGRVVWGAEIHEQRLVIWYPVSGGNVVSSGIFQWSSCWALSPEDDREAERFLGF